MPLVTTETSARVLVNVEFNEEGRDRKRKGSGDDTGENNIAQCQTSTGNRLYSNLIDNLKYQICAEKMTDGFLSDSGQFNMTFGVHSDPLEVKRFSKQT